MKTFWTVLFSVVLAVCASVFFTKGNNVTKEESVYERVVRTNTLRCGYGLFEPFFMRDANTGKLSGIFYDLTEQLGESLGVKIEWVGEIDWGQIAQALQTRKIDAMCAGIWASAARGRQIGFSDPLFFTAVEPVVREGDTRFDNNIETVNDPAITIAINDGDITDEIAKRDFPQAKTVSQTNVTGEDQLLIGVATRKADITFTNRTYLAAYNRNNPGKLRLSAQKRPVRLYGNTYGVDIREHELQKMINTAVLQLIYSGAVEKMVAKYTPADMAGIVLQPADPYKQ